MQSIIIYIAGFVLFMFTRRSELVPTIPVMNIIAPVFILKISRTLSIKKWVLLIPTGFLLSINIALWNLFKFEDISRMILTNIIRSSLLALVYSIPFIIDRLLYPKFRDKPVISTFIYPVIVSAFMFLSSLEGPFDGSGFSSKYVFGPLWIKQALSLGGVPVFVFLSSWLTSLTVQLWSKKHEWKNIRINIAIYVSVLLLLSGFGGIRLLLKNKVSDETVKTAAVVLVPEDRQAVNMSEIFKGKIVSPFNETLLRVEKLTREAALNNAEIISLQEFTMLIPEKDREKLEKAYKRIAEENNIYLSATYAWFGESDKKGENKHLFIDSRGEILLSYTKRYLLGFGSIGETSVFKKGPTVIQSAETPFGRIGISTCRDMDFPGFIRQAGRSRVDIMLSPSYDWPKSTGPSYTDRAVEYGFSLVRPVYNGVTYAEDSTGAILEQMDSDETKNGIMYAEVSTRGMKTLYSMLGDWFGWLTVIVMSAIIVTGVIKKEEKTGGF